MLTVPEIPELLDYNNRYHRSSSIHIDKWKNRRSSIADFCFMPLTSLVYRDRLYLVYHNRLEGI